MDIDSLLQPLDPLGPAAPRNTPRPRQPWHWQLGQWQIGRAHV